MKAPETLTSEKTAMTIQDQIAADQQAVADAQAKLEAAQAQLAADQAKLDAITPHLSLLDRIEAEFTKVAEAPIEELHAGFDALRSNVSAHIAEMRALFNQ